MARKGRPTKFDQEYISKLEYFAYYNSRLNKFPTVKEFCRWLSISRDTFYRWAAKEPAFALAYEHFKMAQSDIALDLMFNHNKFPREMSGLYYLNPKRRIRLLD